MISGITSGFRLGFDPLVVSLWFATQNMPSASLHPAVIDQYLLTELQKGHVAGPYSMSPIPNLHVGCFGVIPKKYQPEKWPLILDLSSPLGHSIALLDTRSSNEYCLRKELESLISHLQHACKVIPLVCTFLPYMINLLLAFWQDDHPIRLTVISVHLPTMQITHIAQFF